MKAVVYIIGVYFFIGCSSESEIKNAQKTEQSEIVNLLGRVQGVNLPFIFEACSAPSVLSEPFIEDGVFESGPSLLYRVLHMSDRFYSVISLYPADCYIPILTTYDERGEIIDQKKLFIGKCGIDCGFSCSEKLIIGADNKIEIFSDIIKVDCDSLYNEIPESREVYSLMTGGGVDSKGRIYLNEIIDDRVKG